MAQSIVLPSLRQSMCAHVPTFPATLGWLYPSTDRQYDPASMHACDWNEGACVRIHRLMIVVTLEL